MDADAAVKFTKEYTENILTFFGVNIAAHVGLVDDIIEIDVPASPASRLLIGRNAETLRSLQLIIMTALKNQEAEVVRVNLDIADYKKQRAEKVERDALEMFERVRQTGEPLTKHLSPVDRRTVHKLAEQHPDIETFSEGEGRDRQLVIRVRQA